MNSNLKRKIERLKQVAGFSGYSDWRAYSCPNTLFEAIKVANLQFLSRLVDIIIKAGEENVMLLSRNYCRN